MQALTVNSASGRHALFLSAILSAFPASLADATEETTDPYHDNLLAHWGGQRDRLSEVGIGVAIEYKGDFWSVISGGLRTGNNFAGNLNVRFELDGEKLFGIEGNKACIYFINNDGGHPNASRIGSRQGIDNIEVNKDSPKLFEAWVDQSFFERKLSVLAGLHDLNSEFLQTDSTNNFLMPVMQIGQEIAQSGQNGPSIFPNSALATRIKYMPTEKSYIQGAVFDGIAGDPQHLYGNRFNFNGGALLIGEAAYMPESVGEGVLNKFAAGAWMYTRRFPDMADTDGAGNPIRQRSAGAYLLSSYQFYHDTESGRSATVFLRPGIADGDTRPIEWAYETGLVEHGFIPARPDSEIGIGLAQAHHSGKYIRSVLAAGKSSNRSEYSLELYYRDKLHRGISMQPDLQYIINPGANPQVKNATAIGIRTDINF